VNLTIEQVSKLTKLSIPTLYTYASRQKIGKKVGNRKVFSQSDVQKILKSSKKSPKRKKVKSAARKTSRKKNKTQPILISKTKPRSASVSSPSPKPTKRSFWTRLFGSRTK
jgi:DNA-binding transcriptional MerR regulator